MAWCALLLESGRGVCKNAGIGGEIRETLHRARFGFIFPGREIGMSVMNETSGGSSALSAAPRASSRVLLCGVGPLPATAPDRLHAPGVRLWGFARALTGAGCEVDLLEVAFTQAISGGQAHLHRLSVSGRESAASRNAAQDVKETVFQGIALESTPLASAPPPQLIARQLGAQSYDAVLSTTDVMNDACARTCGALPLWCDWFGHPMAERQSMAAVHASDEGVAAQWDYILASLLRGDRLSGCSDAQRLALLGELGACGRLNRFTDGRDPVVSLPPAAVLDHFQAQGNAFRGKTTPREAFVVLWAGGYNTWADVDTLAAGLIAAMQRDPDIHFVSAGGAITGHDERTYARFRAQMDASPVIQRCHFAGWVSPREVAGYYLEADVAINSDAGKLEGELGTRHRLLDWVSAGLPVISGHVCELARDLSNRGLIDTFAPRDAGALADLLIRVARSPREAARARAEKARAYLLEFYSPSRLFKPMCEWALRPERAPDLGDKAVRLPDVPFEIPNNPLSRRRAAEWLAVQPQAQGAGECGCPITSFLGGIFRRFKRG